MRLLKVFTAFILGVIVLSLTAPAYAKQGIDLQLEQQVLQILHQHPEAILQAVQDYEAQQEAAQEQTRQLTLDRLKTHPQELMGTAPVLGEQVAPIMLVEFSDFQCPFCAQASEVLQRFIKKHQGEVRLVYKHYPLPFHPEAMPAAQAAWAAQQQGKFWEFHDALFSSQGQLGENLYQSIARKLGLNLKQFEQDRILAVRAIEEDVLLAEQIRITGTPFLVMNGQVLLGADLAQLEEALLGQSNQPEESS